MFFVDKQKKYIVDSSGGVVGEIKDKKFTQDTPHLSRLYSDGLLPSELEQVSEAMQRVPRASK